MAQQRVVVLVDMGLFLRPSGTESQPSIKRETMRCGPVQKVEGWRVSRANPASQQTMCCSPVQEVEGWRVCRANPASQ